MAGMDDDNIQEQRYLVGRKFFIHAPPFKGRRSKETGKFLSKRLARIQMPFTGAEPWQHSIYYFWWEFLRRHDGYKACCERGGKGEYAKLYADFGNIHAHDDFWKWWSEKVDSELWAKATRGEILFAEPPARHITPIDRMLNTQTTDTMTVTIPLEVRTPQLVKQLRRLLAENKKQVMAARGVSRALYPVHNAVRLNSLYLTLCAWDVWVENKDKMPKYEMCDLVGGINYNPKVEGDSLAMLKRQGIGEEDDWYREVRTEVNRRKAQAFTRYQKAAEDYIASAGRGEFPKRR